MWKDSRKISAHSVKQNEECWWCSNEWLLSLCAFARRVVTWIRCTRFLTIHFKSTYSRFFSFHCWRSRWNFSPNENDFLIFNSLRNWYKLNETIEPNWTETNEKNQKNKNKKQKKICDKSGSDSSAHAFTSMFHRQLNSTIDCKSKQPKTVRSETKWTDETGKCA